MKPAVWAPSAQRVDLRVGADTLPLTAGADGWFRLDEPVDEADYAFCLDGGDPRPDPRSRWQPHGVHGPSRPFDPAEHQWHDKGFAAAALDEAVIYELHIGTFTTEGTFAAAIDRLAYLADLGITHVELLPVNTYSGRQGWGYDGVDLFAPHPAYGTPADLQSLVDACHQAGLAVLLDVVYNHLGPEGNYLGQFGPYFTDRYRTPWGDAVNVDGRGSDEVRDFFIDNAVMWLRDYHIDGLRLDAMHALIDTSAVHLLEDMQAAVEQLMTEVGRPLVLIAEHDGNDPRLVRPPEKGGYGLAAHWNDDFHHSLHTALTGEQLSYYTDFDGLRHVAECLQHGYAYRGQHAPFRGHRQGREPVGVRGDALVSYLQNHDQIGNRAGGERIGEMITAGRQKVGAALLLTSPFVPLLFQGEEWAASTPFPFFADHEDEQLREAVRAGRLAEFEAFGWSADVVADPEAEATFLNAKLDWSEPAQTAGAHHEMLEWYRTLLALRRDTPRLRDPHFERITATVDADTGVLTVDRDGILVIAHLGDTRIDVTLDRTGATSLLAASDAGVVLTDVGVMLVPDSVAIVRPAKADDRPD